MTKIDIEAMEDEIDDIVFDVILKHKTRNEAVKELLDLFLVSKSVRKCYCGGTMEETDCGMICDVCG